jgi:iron complex outermembrane receptor protein
MPITRGPGLWVCCGWCLGLARTAFADPPSTTPESEEVRHAFVGPRLLAEVMPEYPADAADAHGDVVVEVTVGVDGLPTDARVTSGPEVFRGSALAAASALRFAPATDHGEPVAVRLPVTFHFAPPLPPEAFDEGIEVVEVHATDPDAEDLHARVTLDLDALERATGSDLAETVSEVPGVTLARGSADVAKPIIRGQSERRLLLLRDGVRHESQKWGADHAPEVDPFSAGSIGVIRGAAGARFGPDAIGGVILVDPPAMRREPGVGGRTLLSGGLNGRRGYGALRLDWAPEGARAWSARLEGDLSRSAALDAPDYTLGNTGSFGWNLGAALQWLKGDTTLRATWQHYALQAGVFFGQRASTPDDFREQVARGTPPNADLWTRSYAIERPFQAVDHDVSALHLEAALSEAWSLSAVYAFQLNRRREFDTVRNADEVGPQYDFTLRTHSLDATATHDPIAVAGAGLGGGAAIQGTFQENVYGGLPLLPNYRSFQAGAAWFERLSWPRFDLEGAARLDGLSRTAYFGADEFAIHERRGALDERDCAGDAVRACPDAWEAVSATLGGLVHLAPGHVDLKVEGSSANRFPNVDELYLTGAAPTSPVYALGAPDLVTEKSLGGTATLGGRWSAFTGEVSAFASRIDDYVWFAPALAPDGRPAFDVTIRGTFPRWEFRQVDADFHGVDGRIELGPDALVGVAVQGAVVRARERTTGTFLTGTPPDRASAELTVRPPGLPALRHPSIGVRLDAVARQSRVTPALDFAPPPPGYLLVGALAEAGIPVRGTELRLAVEGRNLANARYREYTSLTRYFADQPGRDVLVRLAADL